ncbi:MAG: outer-membrane lipoprotein carrier protein LolA [Bacteroidia bacterium]|nr:outer-membrane lipoprotein carrier protein LolA [Bacteroidia bacterium]
MMYKKLIALVSILAFGLTLSFAHGPDDKAKRILLESKKTFESLKDFSANFTYAIQNAKMDRKPQPRRGFFKYAFGMYTIAMSEQDIYCNKEKVWLVIKDQDAPEVSIMNYDERESFSIDGIFDVYRHSAKAQYQGQEKVGTANAHRIFMAITEPGLGYNQATVWVDVKTNLPIKVKLKDRNQTETIYEFSNFKKNQGFTKKDFEFDVASFKGEVFDETE